MSLRFTFDQVRSQISPSTFTKVKYYYFYISMYECISTASLNTAYFCPTHWFQVVFFIVSSFHPFFFLRLKLNQHQKKKKRKRLIYLKITSDWRDLYQSGLYYIILLYHIIVYIILSSLYYHRTADINTQITERAQGHPNPNPLPTSLFLLFDIIQIHLHVSTSTATAARRPAHKSSREKSADRRRNECCHQETWLKASRGVLLMGPSCRRATSPLKTCSVASFMAEHRVTRLAGWCFTITFMWLWCCVRL